jgi:hypothetical protein
MKLLHLAVVGLPLVLAAACDRSPATQDAAHFATLQNGTATLRCHQGADYFNREVTDITPTGIITLTDSCDVRELVVYYEGEIDQSLAQFLTNVSEFGFAYHERSLAIHSPGGDVQAAIQIGDLISQTPWRIFVARSGEAGSESTARCYSACIFVLAAGRERLVIGEVGIHRIYPGGSQATSREELAREISGILDQAKTFMERNGVSASIVDDMMSVPSSEIRILTTEELDHYGLGIENAAQVDLERLDLERRCGSEFVVRLAAAEQEQEQLCSSRIQQACPNGAAGCERFEEALRICVDEANTRFGFPDPACPEDGPSFICADGSLAKDCGASR